jgi:hypothetical protein
MSQQDISMRVAAIAEFLDRHGPSTAKTIGLSLGHSESYAIPYLQAGRESRKLVEVSRKQPIKWGLPRHLSTLPLLPTTEGLPMVGFSFKASEGFGKTIEVLRVFHGYQTVADVIIHAVNQHAADVTVKHRISLKAIEEEMDRHAAAMSRLRKGN